MKKYLLLIVIFILLKICLGQKQELSNELIWGKGQFNSQQPSAMELMPDGIHFTTLLNNFKPNYNFKIIQHNFKDSSDEKIILQSSDIEQLKLSLPIKIDGFETGPDQNKVLLIANTEPIYRHSKVASLFLWDGKLRQLVQLTNDTEKVRSPAFSPNGKWISYILNNDIWIYSIASKSKKRITNDGCKNKIINGAPDWAYEEEFNLNMGYEWSLDGESLAFLRFDESKVSTCNLEVYTTVPYPSLESFKYPKAGDKNSIVSLHVYNINDELKTTIDIGNDSNCYIPRIKWTYLNSNLSFIKINRKQNCEELYVANAKTGASNLILIERDSAFIELNEHLLFLKNNKCFLWLSDRDGYNHIYNISLDGKKTKQITRGNWDVDELIGFDDLTNTIYYTSDESSVKDKLFYSINIDGTNKKILSRINGTNRIQFNSPFKYFINTYTNYKTPPQVEIYSSNGTLIRVLENNHELLAKLNTFALLEKKFFQFKTSDGILLDGWMIRPPNWDSLNKYPVFMTFYGGPHHNEVKNDWGGNTFLWHNYLAQLGYIIVCVDNRGTEGKGRYFKKCIYKQLGKFALDDQIETAKFLSKQSYVDKTRIGVEGWSFGGYLSALCMTKGYSYFKMGIAIAPVTNWRFYDSIYTERYMDLPQDNPSGYDDNSPLFFANELKNPFLLIHGSEDDNVHLQNTMCFSKELIKANKAFDQFIFPDKNHGIYGDNTRLYLYTKLTDFIIHNL